MIENIDIIRVYRKNRQLAIYNLGLTFLELTIRRFLKVPIVKVRKLKVGYIIQGECELNNRDME